MRYFGLACDYDGTLALNGEVNTETSEALKRVRESGRKLILVTGRVMDELRQIFPRLDLFDWVVAENGALLYNPETRDEKLLAERPPGKFAGALAKRNVEPISVGRVIVATWQPHETTVLETIRDLGLELQVVFNKGAVMVLPSGVNKATGLKAALWELGLSPHNAVGIGDAENDHAFLSMCECAVAVANALPSVKEQADLVTDGDHGAGVIELIDKLLTSDLSELDARFARNSIALGSSSEGQELQLRPYGTNALVVGTSQSGKTTLTTAIIERIVEEDYQVCVIDPEGDYSGLDSAVVLGGDQTAPTADEVLELLSKPEANVVVNLLGIELEERPQFFLTSLLPRLYELRARTGRPHWIVIDEAHHLLPSSFDPAQHALPKETSGLLMITLNPVSLAPAVLSVVDIVIAIGESPERAIRDLSLAVGVNVPHLTPTTLAKGEALIWSFRDENGPIRVRSISPKGERRRHRRKYAEGELPADRSFYFRGPEGKLNLRAQNLMLFLQLADGVDDATWLHHLRQADYSRWFRDEINDEELAAEVFRIEQQSGLSAKQSREAIKAAVEERYTAPA
jgi:HAD superfamily hydrolase (TIGR01484 family)